MNYVQPIKDINLVTELAFYFQKRNDRDYIMYLCGIYSGLRISDILKLRVMDVKGKKSVSMRETKTGKYKLFPLHPLLKKELERYCKDKSPEEFLIKSREDINKSIGRSMAYKILRKAANEFGIESMGTHTLRKTFGYHFYQQYKDVATLQKIFNHSHPSITLKYIGIEQDEIDCAIKGLILL